MKTEMRIERPGTATIGYGPGTGMLTIQSRIVRQDVDPLVPHGAVEITLTNDADPLNGTSEKTVTGFLSVRQLKQLHEAIKPLLTELKEYP